MQSRQSADDNGRRRRHKTILGVSPSRQWRRSLVAFILLYRSSLLLRPTSTVLNALAIGLLDDHTMLPMNHVRKLMAFM